MFNILFNFLKVGSLSNDNSKVTFRLSSFTLLNILRDTYISAGKLYKRVIHMLLVLGEKHF